MRVDHLRNAEKDPRPKGRETMNLNASKLSGGLVGTARQNSMFRDTEVPKLIGFDSEISC